MSAGTVGMLISLACIGFVVALVIIGLALGGDR